MNLAYWIGIVMVAGIFGGPTQAAPEGNTVSPVATLDSDDDKTIDISEMGKAASDTFDNIDTDGDGKIDLQTIGNPLPTAQFKKADADKDGFLDKNEYFAVCDGLLRAADKDKDGTLDDQEFNSMKGKKLHRLIQ